MRRNLFLLIGLQAALAAGLVSASGETVAGLKSRLAGADKITIIDVRSPLAYRQSHIPGAINIPAANCSLKKLPPIGQVIVCGDGLGGDEDTQAAAALAQKPGIKADVLEGGFAAWNSSQSITTRGAGLKKETFNYITYSRLKTANPEGVFLMDLRQRTPAAASALTDLDAEFPQFKHGRSLAQSAVTPAAGPPPLLVLIDNGDGTAEETAAKLKASGMHRYVILAGGEMIISRHGQAGLQRLAPSSSAKINRQTSAGGAR